MAKTATRLMATVKKENCTKFPDSAEKQWFGLIYG